MSFASPRSPNKPSFACVCHRTHDPKPRRSSGSRSLALPCGTPWSHQGCNGPPQTLEPKSALRFEVPQLARSYTSMGSGIAELPPVCLELPHPHRIQVQAKPALPAEHPRKANSPYAGCDASLSIPMDTWKGGQALVAWLPFQCDHCHSTDTWRQ